MLNKEKAEQSEDHRELFDCVYSVGTWSLLIALMIIARAVGV